MNTSFATSLDGCRIAYDVSGNGSPIVLLHGGGHTRQNWHDVGYVNRLKSNFKVITIDIRGNGESHKPTDSASYAITKHCEDILAVVDACDIELFTICGFSYGGNIGRYLAAQSTRVAKLVMIGIPFGLGASGDFRQLIISYRNHWLPIVQALANGTLDNKSLSPEDQDRLQGGNIPVTLARLSAMLEWKSIEPKDLLCPTLWLAGSSDTAASTSIEEYKTLLDASKVRIQSVEGLTHEQEFTEIDKVFPFIFDFAQT